MPALILSLLLATNPASPAASKIDTLFVKVGPIPISNGRSPKCQRAIVLIHGLSLHPFSPDKATVAKLRAWQLADAPLVKSLSFQGDVYSFAYAQSTAVDHIAEHPTLLNEMINLQNAGYREIILIGHSAGGIIARNLVEDHPLLGITRVIQICTPNVGSGWASLKTARGAQMDFLVSLSRTVRLETLKKRENKKIPDKVEFACIVASCRLAGDGVVFSKSQWSPDLQAQGIPAHYLRTTHWEVMANPKTAETLVRLVKEPQPRWDERKVQEMRKTILP